MSRPDEQTTLSRRDLFLTGAIGAASLVFGAESALAQEAPQQRRQRRQGQGQGQRRGPYAPFRMGIQSYSLRHFKLDEALAKTQQLGLRNWEAYPAHIPQTDDPAKIKEMLDKLLAHQVRLRSWGVVGFDADEAKTRKVLDFAKAMNTGRGEAGFVISADPNPDSFAVLDRVLEQYPNIFIAIHNHGPGHRYDKITDVTKAIQGHHERIGACVDTGHYLRSGEDPVAAVKAFGKRTYGVHLKDVKDKTKFTEVGKGDLKVADLLKELRGLQYRQIVSLEYEEHPENPISYIEECLAATREAIKQIAPPARQ